MRGAAIALLTLAAACSPAAVATDVTRRAAQTVVEPVVASAVPSAAARTITDCVLANATNAELNDLARDIGVSVGTVTRGNVSAILARPSTVDCITGRGLPIPVI